MYTYIGLGTINVYYLHVSLYLVNLLRKKYTLGLMDFRMPTSDVA